MDVATVDVTPPVRSVEAVAFGQELFQRTRPALERLPHGAVAARELRTRCAPVRLCASEIVTGSVFAPGDVASATVVVKVKIFVAVSVNA